MKIMIISFKKDNNKVRIQSCVIVDMINKEVVYNSRQGCKLQTCYNHMLSNKIGKIVSNIKADNLRKIFNREGLPIHNGFPIDYFYDFIEIPELSSLPVRKLISLDICLQISSVDDWNLYNKCRAVDMAKLVLFYSEHNMTGHAILQYILRVLYKALSENGINQEVASNMLDYVIDIAEIYPKYKSIYDRYSKIPSMCLTTKMELLSEICNCEV